MLYKLDENEPIIDGDFYVAESASVIGKVRLCNNASIWFGAVLRGDTELTVSYTHLTLPTTNSV